MNPFLNHAEDQLCEEFLAKGIVKLPVEDTTALDRIRDFVWLSATRSPASTTGQSLGRTHEVIGPAALNDCRLHVIRSINAEPWFRPAYYSLARSAVNAIAGNELVMQRNVNLSIQLPNDASSLLPIHCDTWSGDSPYEVVLWVPLVDCHGTKSMFFVDAKADAEVQPRLREFSDSEELYQAVKDKAQFMNVKYGECLIFTQNILHGNRVNETNETRWSLNCRFKSALSPYADKKLGEFFEPITLRPATKLGMRYELPSLQKG